MKNKFDIEKIANFLSNYKEDIKNFNIWKFDIESLKLISTDIDQNAIKNKSNFENEIYLKEIIAKKLNEYSNNNEEDKFKEISLWIIEKWGGILSANKENTEKLISRFYKDGIIEYNRISSISKVASFWKPSEYVIYDSRVAYALNWIILSTNAGEKFFPVPEGRNSKMIAFDINVLIRLKFIHNYIPDFENQISRKSFMNSKDKNLFIDKKHAYPTLNALIKEINKKLWQNDSNKITKLYYTEMLLFAIADNIIINDIISKLHFEITK